MSNPSSSSNGQQMDQECKVKDTNTETRVEPIQGGETLEDLLTTLSQQIKSSDWLQQNTAEKFALENPEVAQVFKAVIDKHDSTTSKDQCNTK